MRNLISILLFLLFAWLGMWWYYGCSWCLGNRTSKTTVINEKQDPDALARAKKAYEDSIALAHGLFAKDILSNDVFRYPDNLRINNQNSDVHIPDGIIGFDTAIASHLAKHQDQDLIIYGYQTPKEKELDSLTGIKRADFIKNKLIGAGINGDRLVSQSKTLDFNYDSNGIYKGGIDLNFHIIEKDRLKEIEEGIANKILFSDFGSEQFKPDATLANYTFELKNYLEKYPDKKVSITGHTDNVGTLESNKIFGQNRADNVRSYFVSKGIPATKLNTSSKGETSPIDTNETEEGRSKNRRIEIIVN